MKWWAEGVEMEWAGVLDGPREKKEWAGQCWVCVWFWGKIV